MWHRHIGINRIIGTGTNLGLTILLDAGIGEYYCSSTNSYGFKFLLHSPNEAPRITNYGTQVSNGYESRVVIAPTISEATDPIKKLPIDVRQCYFENENYLMYYRYVNKNFSFSFLFGNCFSWYLCFLFTERIRVEWVLWKIVSKNKIFQNQLTISSKHSFRTAKWSAWPKPIWNSATVFYTFCHVLMMT